MTRSFRTKLNVACAAAALSCLTLPAHAKTFTPPEGCTAWMTVQARACRVSNYYKCSADAPGDQWRADFDQEGIFFQSRINAEAQWVESIDLPDGTRQTLDPGAPDPASFSTLVGTGVDPWTFSLSKTNGEASTVTGQDKLTGQTVTIDGITLQQTEFDFTETDGAGTVLRRAHGNEYLKADWGLFFAGPGETDLGDGQFVPIDGSPLQFIFPGEPGFMATQPLFECDDVLSKGGTAPKDILPARY
jgi:hypothetical protein